MEKTSIVPTVNKTEVQWENSHSWYNLMIHLKNGDRSNSFHYQQPQYVPRTGFEVNE